MCTVAAKYISGIGWVGVKNLDKKRKPLIRIRKSFRRKIERLYIWDDKSKYTEGVNEFGVAIISSPLIGETSETLDGFNIRKALFEKDVTLALSKMIELEVIGYSLIFDKNSCFILEGAMVDGQYIHQERLVDIQQNVIRTNHGVLLPDTGFEKGTQERENSEIRAIIVDQELRLAKSSSDVLSAISRKDQKDPQTNPFREDSKRNSYKTAGQIMIVPSQNTMHYRSIWGEVRFNLDKLNSNREKTFFEIASTRSLISSEYLLMKSFKNFITEEDNISDEKLVLQAIETLSKHFDELTANGNPRHDKMQAIHTLRKNGVDEERIKTRLVAAGHAEEDIAFLMGIALKHGDVKATTGYPKTLDAEPKPNPDGE